MDDLTPSDRLRDALRGLEADDLTAPPAPPPELWDRIAASLDDESTDASSGFDEADIAAAVAPPPARPTSLDRKRRPRVVVRIVAVAAALVLVLLSAFAIVGRSQAPQITEQAVLDSSGLKNPNPPDLRGRAELVTVDGHTRLDVDVPDLPAGAAGEVFEVWLLAGTSGRLQSLGLFEGSGHFAVPDGIDTSVYNVVDVSREPVDGDATHSGDSLVRGTLEPVR